MHFGHGFHEAMIIYSFCNCCYVSQITVVDKNDNVPDFLTDPTWINIEENAKVGEIIGEP